MMFDPSAYFGQPSTGSLGFGPQGLFGYAQGQPFFHGPLGYLTGQPGFLQGQQGPIGQAGLPAWSQFGGPQGHSQIGVPPALLGYLSGQYGQPQLGQQPYGQFGQQPYGQFGQQPWPMYGAMQGQTPIAGFASSPHAHGAHIQGPFGASIGQGAGGWPGQLPLVAQQLGMSPFGQLGFNPFSQLGQGPFGQLAQGPFARMLPLEAALAMATGCTSPQLAGWSGQSHLASTLGRGITPFSVGALQPAYTG